MSAFNRSDRVEIVGPGMTGRKSAIGQTAEIYTFTGREWCVIEQDMSYGFYPAASLRLVPAFKAGDKVQLKESGNATEVCVVWKTDDCQQFGKPVVMYETTCGLYLDGSELQHAPEPVREPKIGEVWKVIKQDFLVVNDSDREGLRIVGISEGTFTNNVMACDGGYHEKFHRGERVFVADSLAAYFKVLP